jgi:hypothetical protein
MKSAILWVLAVLLMFSAVVYQRATGPTYPKKGELVVGNQSARYKLIRSDWSIKTNEAALVQWPDLEGIQGGTLYFKRFRTHDELTSVPAEKVTSEGASMWQAKLPAQPAAGKLSYYLMVTTEDGTVRLPAQDEVIIRFKDHVPGHFLWPHVVLMFFSVLIGMRAGLGALFDPKSMKTLAWTALVMMTIGGMILGPIVQKFAFGEYWTGFPFGGDWTDNKMLVMWISWVIAAAILGMRGIQSVWIPRGVILLAAMSMSVAYLIPHSMGGSELNYEAVDRGVDPYEAIKTGKQ